ncbi:MAG: ADP-ribosylglycohydrolase family protein [Cytophagaceae bacterium]|nr:ADP-ribosylglycohydrolase family protein [Cytophagaceae bacterium]
MTQKLLKSTVEAALVGLAVGDALGVPVEFCHRNILRKNPVKNMRKFGVHYQLAGTWSDDSALTFQLVESLIDGYTPHTLARRFLNWYQQAEWSARGVVFDVGIATGSAMQRLEEGISPTLAGEKDEYSNGNGALMRIIPLAFSLLEEADQTIRWKTVCEIASITHGHIRSAVGSFIFVEMARNLLLGHDKQKAYELTRTETADFLVALPAPASELELFQRVLFQDISTLPEKDIYSSGYVIHTLEACFWCFLTTGSFRVATLKAVNLGDDTDTTAALTGGLAGIAYGYKSIPAVWLEELARLDDIRNLASRFADWLKDRPTSTQ